LSTLLAYLQFLPIVPALVVSLVALGHDTRKGYAAAGLLLSGVFGVLWFLPLLMLTCG